MMSGAAGYVEQLLEKYGNLLDLLNEIVTPEAYFETFRRLSDNYSPTLTVSQVQGPLIESLLAEELAGEFPLRVDRNLRGSGSIGITIGDGRAPIWLSAHGDICSYLTGARNGNHYDLTPFCMHRARPGRRDAVALSAPDESHPLDRIAEGVMVTGEDGSVTFESERDDLPYWTRVVHSLPASWNRESDEVVGFIDNQGGSAALLLAARVLGRLGANAVLLVNDEEEGPVDRGNTSFSRAMSRLLHRTPTEMLPDLFIVTDAHQQEHQMELGGRTYFGEGALFTGVTSGARGAVTPPRLLEFTRDLASQLSSHGIQLTENHEYVSRSDDVSALFYSQNVAIIGFPGAYAHFDRTPYLRCHDLVHLTKTLVFYALIAQEEKWRKAYLA